MRLLPVGADHARGRSDRIDRDIQFSIGTSLPVFIVLIFTLGFFMSLGKAAVYKHIPVYYPGHIGAVGGLVGMIGGLGGFILPILFGALNDLTHIWTSCFMLLFAITAIALTWMHITILIMENKFHPDLKKLRFLPELRILKGKH